MLKILVVDDDNSVLLFMEQMFKKTFRLSIKTADNGAKALEMLKDFTPNVICTDISMPEVDGLELVKKVKEDERFANCTLVIMSAVSDKETVGELLKLGVRNYVLKPFNFADTQLRLKKIILPLLKSIKDASHL